jgi:YVTN family beta-propeller protein
VNPLTNMIYVANNNSNDVTVIDGNTNNGLTVIPAGNKPCAITVNEATNKIYVTNDMSGTVTVIDGATNIATTVHAGSNPSDVAVNTVTNKIYVTNSNSGNVTVIDGVTNDTTLVSVGAYPSAVDVNPVTNRIYVTGGFFSNNVIVIDGVTYDTTLVNVGSWPNAVVVNPVINKIYVVNSSNMTVIDGATNSTKSISVSSPYVPAVNPVTNRIYVTSQYGNNFTVIDALDEKEVNVVAGVDSLPHHATYDETPLLTGTAVNQWSPHTTMLLGALNDWVTEQDLWQWATVTSGSGTDSINWEYSWNGDVLLYGLNYVNVVPLEAQAAITNNVGLGTPCAGSILTYPLYRLDGASPDIAWWDSLPDDTSSIPGDSLFGPYVVNASISDNYSGVFRTMLYWNNDSVPLYDVHADTFRGEIPQQIVPVGDSLKIDYYIKAWDKSPDMNLTQTDVRTFRIHHYDLGVHDENESHLLPKVFALGTVYPNPTKSGPVIFRYQLPKTSKVRLDIYDVTGRRVEKFDRGEQAAGYYELLWRGKKVPGVYFYRLTAEEYQSTKKVVIME